MKDKQTLILTLVMGGLIGLATYKRIQKEKAHKEEEKNTDDNIIDVETYE